MSSDIIVAHGCAVRLNRAVNQVHGYICRASVGGEPFPNRAPAAWSLILKRVSRRVAIGLCIGYIIGRLCYSCVVCDMQAPETHIHAIYAAFQGHRRLCSASLPCWEILRGNPYLYQ